MDESFVVSSGNFHTQSTLCAIMDACLTCNIDAKSLLADKLSAYNKIMVSLRVQAQAAPRSTFHCFLQCAFREQHIVQCLTHRFDTLEARDNPDIESHVLCMYGKNCLLCCCTTTCPGLNEQEAAQFDNELQLGEMVACPVCVYLSRCVACLTCGCWGCCYPSFPP